MVGTTADGLGTRAKHDVPPDLREAVLTWAIAHDRVCNRLSHYENPKVGELRTCFEHSGSPFTKNLRYRWLQVYSDSNANESTQSWETLRKIFTEATKRWSVENYAAAVIARSTTHSKEFKVHKNLGEIARNLAKVNTEERDFRDFFRRAAKIEVDETCGALRQVVGGTYTCSQAWERELTKEIAAMSKHSLLAVSYQDEDFWQNRKDRSEYLQIQLRLTRAQRKVVRIFVTTHDQQHRLSDAIKWHSDHGIPHFIIRTDEVDDFPTGLAEDYVIYDKDIGPLVRTGLLIPPSMRGRGESDKTARFTTDPSIVDEYADKWKRTLEFIEALPGGDTWIRTSI
jgi:hypothetical protein